MDMDDVKTLMKKAGIGYLATTDGGRARVRPMGAFLWAGDELWMASDRRTDKCADISQCAEVEICFLVDGWKHVRISGSVAVSENRSDKAALLDAVPGLAQYMQGPDNPEYVVLRLKPRHIRVLGEGAMAYEEIVP